VQLWDASPLTPERRVHREAASLVHFLLERAASATDLRERIRRDPTISEEVRARALELADGRWEAHVRHQAGKRAWELNLANWAVVREPGLDPVAYRLALRRAEAACSDLPDDGQIVNTLGVAQYRVGLYREALATLTRSNTLNGGRESFDLAFLAMAQQRLGQVEQARRTLAQLRAAVKAPSGISDPEGAAFLREAEVLIELDPAFPADPFAP
jgi:uncharacterized protein HemY